MKPGAGRVMLELGRHKSVLLDGEGVVYDQNGMLSFDLIHSKQYDREVSLVAFDLLELDGKDYRPAPLTSMGSAPNASTDRRGGTSTRRWTTAYARCCYAPGGGTGASSLRGS
jgi:hypothetical protein